jgi:hypothetical protein
MPTFRGLLRVLFLRVGFYSLFRFKRLCGEKGIPQTWQRTCCSHKCVPAMRAHWRAEFYLQPHGSCFNLRIFEGVSDMVRS